MNNIGKGSTNMIKTLKMKILKIKRNEHMVGEGTYGDWGVKKRVNEEFEIPITP